MMMSHAPSGIDCSPGAHANFIIFLEKKPNKNNLKKEINLGIFFFTKPDRIAKTKSVFFWKNTESKGCLSSKTDRSYGEAFLGEILLNKGGI